MILTIREHDKHEGTDLPMFSRTGKSTISQYLQFSHHQKKQQPQHTNVVEEEYGDELEDIQMIMGTGSTKPKNIANEMQKIADENRLKELKLKQKKKSFGPTS